MQIDEQLMREVIMDHYEHPRHNTLLNDPSYITVRLKNPSCGDDLTIQCQFADLPSEASESAQTKARGKANNSSPAGQTRITDIRQKGTGCSICLASASMMADLLKQSSVQEAEQALANFTAMIQAEHYDADLLGDAQALCGISQVIPRIKCANLAWQALQAAIDCKHKQLATDTAADTVKSTIELEIKD